MNEQPHPDPDRWWERKWKMAIFGCFASGASIGTGLLIVLLYGPEYGDAVHPLSIAGMWGGLSLAALFGGQAVAENIAKMRKH